MTKSFNAHRILNLFVSSAGLSAPSDGPALSKDLSALLESPDPESVPNAAELIDEYLKKASAPPTAGEDLPKMTPLRQAYRRSAAVLTALNPDKLRPMGMTAEEGDGARELFDDLVEVYDPPTSRQRWMLQPEVRSGVIRELGTRPQLLAALNTNPPSERPTSILQRTLEGYIRGENPPILDLLPQDQLAAHLQATRWLETSSLPLSSPEDIQAAIDQREVPAVFEKMAGKNFVGREAELALLCDYVEVLPASSGLEGLRRQIRQWLHLKTKPPLVIHAAGGVGKTTLISKFLLDHRHVPEEMKFPYVYLDFDSPRISPNHPDTILSEATRQLSVQYPDFRKELEGFLEYEHGQAIRQEWDESDLIMSGAGAAGEVAAAGSLSRFAQLVEKIISRTAPEGSYTLPLLIVLDTYEEVQYRGFKDEIQLWNLMDAIQREFPTLRVVIFGRANVEEIPTSSVSPNNYALSEMDRSTAWAFLNKLGVADSVVANSLLDAVGGNPLSLKLAADIYRREAGQKGLPSEELRNSLIFFSANEILVQGQLYQRILNHVHDADARKIAHPGLVLRRITPELIKEVLPGPCEIVVPNKQRARELFDLLSREVALVTMIAHDVLATRPDLRRVMLDAMRRDKPAQTKEISRLAVEYYSARPGPESRAEEIYHRLQLCAPSKLIESRWMSGIEPFLKESLDELPAASKTVLATFLGIRLPKAEIEAAGIAEWERYTAREADELVKLGRYNQALTLLQERKERTEGSPLYLIEAKVWAFRERWKDATRSVQLALKVASASGNRKDMLEAILLAAEISKQTNRLKEADEYLKQAISMAQAMRDPVKEILAVLQRMRLRGAYRSLSRKKLRKSERLELSPTFEKESEELRAKMAELVGQLPEKDWLENKSLVRASTSLLGLDYADFLIRMLRRVGVGELNEEQLVGLRSGLERVCARSPAVRSLTQDFAKTLKVGSPEFHSSNGLSRGLELGFSLRTFFGDLLTALQANQRLDEFLERLVLLEEPEGRGGAFGIMAVLFSRETKL